MVKKYFAPLWFDVLYGPQISICMSSKTKEVLDLLIGNTALVCLAKGHKELSIYKRNV